jgi:hypothetical protein
MMSSSRNSLGVPASDAIVPSQENKKIIPVEFNKWVRHYVHYDTLTKSFQQQTSNARKMKDAYEEKIVETLEDTKMKNAIIQIAGGTVKLIEDKHFAPLTFIHLESMLHDYFRANSVLKVDAFPMKQMQSFVI